MCLRRISLLDFRRSKPWSPVRTVRDEVGGRLQKLRIHGGTFYFKHLKDLPVTLRELILDFTHNLTALDFHASEEISSWFRFELRAVHR